MEQQTDIKDNKFADVPIRVKTWVYIIIVFVAGISHPVLMKILVAYLSFQALSEFLKLFKLNAQKFILPVVVAALQLILLNYFEIKEYLSYALVLMLVLILYLKLSKTKAVKFPLMVFGLLVCFFSLAFLSFIRDSEFGLKGIIFLVVVTELNDVFQYLMGKFFGKHKIVPKISPNKTLEGFLGGLLLTIILSLILGYFLLETPLLLNLCLGLLLGSLGFLGDLTISYIKRKAEVKDTGTLLPGHGGLLDRIDSLIYNAPAFFLFIYLIVK